MKKCLIVVDYQNDFVCGSLGFPGAAGLEPFIAAKINEYRGRGDEIIFTFDTHGEDYPATKEGRRLPVAHCMRGTPGHDLYGSIAALKREGDVCFFKSTFGSGELHEYLKTRKYQSIELCGVVSYICVISNAVLAMAAQPETAIIVDARCTAGGDEKLNAAALAVMESLHIDIVN